MLPRKTLKKKKINIHVLVCRKVMVPGSISVNGIQIKQALRCEWNSIQTSIEGQNLYVLISNIIFFKFSSNT